MQKIMAAGAVLFFLLTTQAAAGGRPSQCPPRLWCGCAAAIKVFGEPRRDLWSARAWLKLGRPVPHPAPGAVVVYARGKRGGHVGIVVSVVGPGRIIMWSGNDGNAIRTRERSTAGVLGYRVL